MIRGSVVFLLFITGATAYAQSASLYFEQVDVPGYVGNIYVPPSPQKTISPAIAATSLMAVPMPEPRQFAVGDLITIIIRETTQADWSGKLDTSKEVDFNGAVDQFPRFSFADFALRNGIGTPIQLDMGYEHEFEGEGELRRHETITGRMTARIIDVKPNGTLAIEATKYNQVDKETLRLTLTGVCRSDDVSIENTILSSQIYDLHLVKEHTGELRKATRKGILTQLFELLFNF